MEQKPIDNLDDLAEKAWLKEFGRIIPFKNGTSLHSMIIEVSKEWWKKGFIAALVMVQES